MLSQVGSIPEMWSICFTMCLPRPCDFRCIMPRAAPGAVAPCFSTPVQASASSGACRDHGPLFGWGPRVLALTIRPLPLLSHLRPCLSVAPAQRGRHLPMPALPEHALPWRGLCELCCPDPRLRASSPVRGSCHAALLNCSHVHSVFTYYPSLSRVRSFALAGVAQWVGHHPTSQRVTSSIPGRETHACIVGQVPQLGAYQRQPINGPLAH